MASKYANVVKDLPHSLGTEPDYQEKVDAVKTAMRAKFPQNSSSLTHEYVEALRDVNAVKDVLYQANLRLEAISQLLEDQYKQDKLESVHLKSGPAVFMHYEPVGQVEDKELFRQWCIKNGFEKSLQLWPSTMNSLVKERVLVNEPVPDGTRAYAQRKIKCTGMKDLD